MIAGYDYAGNEFPSYYVASYAAADGHLVWDHRDRGDGDFTSGSATGMGVAADGSIFVSRLMGSFAAYTYITGYKPADGAVFWEQRRLLFASSQSRPLALVADGGVAVTGTSAVSGRIDLTTVKYNTASQLLNISTRANVQTDDGALVDGFIVTGSSPKKVLLRGIGPSLPVLGALQDPVVEFHAADGTIVTNDNWRDTQEAEIAATSIAPSNDNEAAVIASVPPGAHTVIVRGKNGSTGLGLVEVYDLDAAAPSTCANISTRGAVGAGENAMIGGFILRASRPGPVLVRALGPSLPVDGKLSDPTVELFDANGSSFAFNDNWRDSQEQQIIATGIPPSDDRESAVVQTILPGAYTAIVRGVSDSTGIGLVEAYALE